MKFMHSDLYFHPDASRKESLRLGSLLFIKDEDENPGRCVVGFYQAEGSPLMEAQRLSSDRFFETMFQDFNRYIQFVANSTKGSQELSQEQVALSFISNLPQNLRASRPEGWPPSRFFTQAASERHPIMVFDICAAAV